MGKANRNGRGIGVSQDETTVATLPDTAANETAGMSGEGVPSDNGEVPEEGKVAKVKKDRSNPPVYGIIGVNGDTGATDLIATYPTRHQLSKNLPQARRMAGRHYSDLQFVKIKYIEIYE